MANDKHFRVKNGVKVGDTEVITNCAKVVASTIEVANVILPTKISGIETTISSLSAALGTYEAALGTKTLIESLKETVSGLAITAQSYKESASSSKSAALSARDSAILFRDGASNAKDNADLSASDANLAQILAEAYRADACGHEAAAQTALTLTQSSRDAAGRTLSSTQCAQRLAENAASDALAARILATEDLVGTRAALSDTLVSQALTDFYKNNALNSSSCSINAASDALAAFESAQLEAVGAANLRQSASASNVIVQVAKEATNNAKSDAEAAKNAALAFRDSASLFSNSARLSSSAANISRLLAVNFEGLASNAQSDALAAKNLADAAKTSSQNAASDILALAISASSAFVSIESISTSAALAISSIIVAKTSASSSLIQVQVSEASASSALSSTLLHKSTALNAALSASGAAASARLAKVSASTTLIEVQTAQASASSSLVSILGYESTSLNASSDALAAKTTAVNTVSLMESDRQDASTKLATIESLRVRSLSAKDSASAAASASRAVQASALVTKSEIDSIEQSASTILVSLEEEETKAINLRLTVSSAMNSVSIAFSNILTKNSEANNISASSNRLLASIEQAESDALLGQLTISGYQALALTGLGTLISSKSSAEVIKLDASGVLVTTRAHESSALSASLSARNASLSAANSASAALSFKVIANTAKDDTSNIKLSASGSLASICSLETSALASKNSASDTLVSIQTLEAQSSNLKETISGFTATVESYEEIALAASGCSQCAAKAAGVSAGAALTQYLSTTTLRQTTSSLSVQTRESRDTALAASTCSQCAALASLQSLNTAFQTTNSIIGLKNTASSNTASTLDSKTIALAASVCAQNSASTALAAERSIVSISAINVSIAEIRNSSSSNFVEILGFRSEALQASISAADSASNAKVAEASASGFAVSAKTIQQTASSNLVTAKAHTADALAARLVAESSANSATTAKNSASAAASAVLVVQSAINTDAGSVSSIQQTASNTLVTIQGYESSSLSSSRVAQDSASASLVALASISSNNVSIQTIQQTASGQLVSIIDNTSRSLSARLSASSAASSTRVSQVIAQEEQERTTQLRQSGSSEIMVYLKFYADRAQQQFVNATQSASNAQVLETEIDQLKSTATSHVQTASSSLTTIQNREQSALTALQSSQSAANAADDFRADARSDAIDIFNFRNTASTRVVSIIASEAQSLSASNLIDGYAASASSLIVEVQQAKLDASSALVSSVEAESRILGAIASASAGAVSLANYVATASDLVVTTTTAKATASSAAVDTLEFRQQALESQNSASSTAATITTIQQAAQTRADEVGALVSRVSDVQLLEARIQNGLNGHYTSNSWVFQDLDADSCVVALANNGFIRIEEVVDGTEEVTNGTFDTNINNWTGHPSNGGSSLQHNNSAIKLNGYYQFGGTAANSQTRGFSQQLTGLNGGTTYELTFDIVDDDGNLNTEDTYIDVVVSEAAFGFDNALLYATNKPRSSSGVILNTHDNITGTAPYRYTFSPDLYGNFYINFTIDGYRGADATFDNISIKDIGTSKTITDSAVAFKRYKISEITGLFVNSFNDKIWRVVSSIPIVVQGEEDRAAIPSNFASDLLGSVIRGAGPTCRAILYSPNGDAKVDVYVDNSGAFPTQPIVEGVNPVNHSFNIKRGKAYIWNESDIVGTLDNADNFIVFKSDVKISGEMIRKTNTDTNADTSPLQPLTNGEFIWSLPNGIGTQTLNPVFVKGGGINLSNLERFMSRLASGITSHGAPNLEAAIRQRINHYNPRPYGDISGDSSISSTDVDLVDDFKNGVSLTEDQQESLNLLISHLDRSYSSIETTFTAPGTGSPYTLYDSPPVTDTSIKASSGLTVTGNGPHVAHSASDRVFAGAHINASDEGHYIALPRQALSDFYVFTPSKLEGYAIATAEPNTITVTDSFGTLIERHELELASRYTPLAIERGKFISSGTSISHTNGPFTFVGTAPFWLVCLEDEDGELTNMFGAVQGILNGQIQQTAVAEQINTLKSSVDGFDTTITQTAVAVDGLEAQYSVKINNNGSISGYGLMSNATTNPSSAFVIQADRFALVNSTDTWTGQVPAEAYVPFEVVGNKTIIKNASIGELSADQIGANAITASKISSKSIGAREISSGVIATDLIAANAITLAKLADGAVSETKITSNAITTPKIKTGNITTDKLAANAITVAKLASDSVNATHITSDAITVTAIKGSAVTGAKIASNAITESKITANAITSPKIKTNAIITSKIASNAITTAKISAGSVDAKQIAAEAITTDKLEANAVTANKIKASAVTTDKLDANAVTANKIAAGAITADKLTANSITGTQISSKTTISVNDKLHLDGTDGGGDDKIRIFGGVSSASAAAAPFRVTHGGELAARDANIRGTATFDMITSTNFDDVMQIKSRSVADGSIVTDSFAADAKQFITNQSYIVSGGTTGASASSHAIEDQNMETGELEGSITTELDHGTSLPEYRVRVVINAFSTTLYDSSLTRRIEFRLEKRRSDLLNQSWSTVDTLFLDPVAVKRPWDTEGRTQYVLDETVSGTVGGLLDNSKYEFRINITNKPNFADGSVISVYQFFTDVFEEGGQGGIKGLVDTNIVSAVEGQPLVYSSVQGNWVNGGEGNFVIGNTGGLTIKTDGINRNFSVNQAGATVSGERLDFDSANIHSMCAYSLTVGMGNMSAPIGDFTKINATTMSAENVVAHEMMFQSRTDKTQQVFAVQDALASWHVFVLGTGNTNYVSTPSLFYKYVASNMTAAHAEYSFYSKGSIITGYQNQAIDDSRTLLYTMWVYLHDTVNRTVVQKVFHVDDRAHFFHNNEHVSMSSFTQFGHRTSTTAPFPLVWTLTPGYNKLQIITSDTGSAHGLELIGDIIDNPGAGQGYDSRTRWVPLHEKSLLSTDWD